MQQPDADVEAHAQRQRNPGRDGMTVGRAAAEHERRDQTVVNAASDPTDKSIPPVRITNVWPTAMIAIGAACCKSSK